MTTRLLTNFNAGSATSKPCFPGNLIYGGAAHWSRDLPAAEDPASLDPEPLDPVHWVLYNWTLRLLGHTSPGPCDPGSYVLRSYTPGSCHWVLRPQILSPWIVCLWTLHVPCLDTRLVIPASLALQNSATCVRRCSSSHVSSTQLLTGILLTTIIPSHPQSTVTAPQSVDTTSCRCYSVSHSDRRHGVLLAAPVGTVTVVATRSMEASARLSAQHARPRSQCHNISRVEKRARSSACFDQMHIRCPVSFQPCPG